MTGAARRRLLPVLAVAAGSSIGLSSCGPQSSAPEALRDTVAVELLQALDGYGWPVDAAGIGCSGPTSAGTISCQAVTTNVPPADVTAGFGPPPGGRYNRPRCPGQLRVFVNGTLLTKVREDPCA